MIHTQLENENLTIYDGGSEYSNAITIITVDTPAKTEISSTYNQMYISFKTSSKVAKMRGFSASIEKIGIKRNQIKMSSLKRFYDNIFFFFHPTDDNCQYWMSQNKLTSPFYPKWFLADGIGCEWLITAPEGHIISLEFEEFKVSFKVYYHWLCCFTLTFRILHFKM